MRHRVLALSPLVAAMLLTSAIFLLPATSDRRQAQTSVDDIQVSATHIDNEDARAPLN